MLLYVVAVQESVKSKIYHHHGCYGILKNVVVVHDSRQG